ncbi:hypothetical protein DFS34DRAFT_624876 [Phlyctochytrium arcticum]|nr:hypothetical protein DFS34DRAFT_624876 [Phlyctochytrium arcticum]
MPNEVSLAQEESVSSTTSESIRDPLSELGTNEDTEVITQTISNEWAPPLPPAGPFPTFAAANEALNEHVLSHGFSLGTSKVINHPESGQRMEVHRPCAYAGEYKPKDEGVPLRARQSRRCGCNYRVVLHGEVEETTSEDGTIKSKIVNWKIRVSQAGHNGHRPLSHSALLTSAQARQASRTPKIMSEALNALISGSSLRHVVDDLRRRYPKLLIIPKDIQNARSKAMEKRLSLLKELEAQAVTDGTVADVTVNEEDHVRILLFLMSYFSCTSGGPGNVIEEIWRRAHYGLHLESPTRTILFPGRSC